MVVLALFAFAGLLAGCSSSSSDSGDTTTTAAKESTTTTTADAPEDTTTTEADTPTTEAGVGEVGDRQAYVDAFAASLASADTTNPFSDDDIDCLANRFLDTIGLDTITSAGVTPEEFGQASDFGGKLQIDESTANDLYDQYDECDVDIKALFKDIAEGFNGTPLTADQQGCIDEILTDDALRTSFVADIQGKTLEDDPLGAIEGCIDFSGGVADSPASPQTIAPPPGN